MQSRRPARGAARELHGFSRRFTTRFARSGGAAAGRQFLDGVICKMEAATLPIRGQVAAVADGLRLPHAHRISLRAHGRRADAAQRLRHRLAHPHRRVDSGQPLGSDPRHLFLLQAGRRLVRLGVAFGRAIRRPEPRWAGCARGAVRHPAAVRGLHAAVPAGAAASRTRSWRLLVTVVAAAASSIHWLARPHLFTLLFPGAVLYAALERVREGRTRVLGVPYLAVLLPVARLFGPTCTAASSWAS